MKHTSITITGYTAKEFKNMLEENKPTGCYICKRKRGEESALIIDNGKDVEIGIEELHFELFNLTRGGVLYHILLCHECCFVLDWFYESFHSRQEMPEEKHSLH